jgi:protein-tyrosine-phosphatase
LCGRLAIAPARLADFGFELVSLGLHASVGEGASSGARELMAERGLDLSGHRARRATQEALLAADRAYCMTRAHREAVLAALPPSKAAGVELLDPKGGDVPDPVGGGRADYLRAAERIEAALRARLDEWA